MSDYNPGAALARGLHTALSSDLALGQILGTPPRLYDYAPDDPVFPYMTYGAMRIEDISGDDALLTSQTLTLHLWSRYGGRAEVLDLLERVRRVIEGTQISPPGAKVISASVLYTDAFRAADRRTLHGLIRAVFKTQPIDQTLEEVA